jgi:Flp pilus assembly protein TadD
MRGAHRGLGLLAGGFILAGAAQAQDVDEPEAQPRGVPPGAIVQPLDTGPGAELRRNLTALAANPRSLEALIAAGRAAASGGDGDAALGFFTRAQEISPSDPRVKAGMGSALVLTLRPETALVSFAEAVRLGASEADLAGDRGLAYDMVGDPRRAQLDYELYLRRHAGDAEVERRLALSLAIGGQRAAALRVIDGQLRRQERAAWRTQAFVLALTGDAAGAEDTAARMMPPANAQAMAPFFARLASLSPAQKAAAVHFGRFPSDGRTYQVASNEEGDGPRQPLYRSLPQAADPVGGGDRRRPGLDDRTGYGARWSSLAPPVTPVRRPPAPAARFAPNPPDAEEDDSGGPPPAAYAPPQPNRGNLPREAPAFSPNANLTLDTSHDERVTPPSGQPSPYPADQPPSVQRFQTIQQLPGATAHQSPPAPSRTPPGPSPRPAFSDVATFVQTLPGDHRAGHAPAPAAETPAERRRRDAAARAVESRYGSGASSAHGESAHTSHGRHASGDEEERTGSRSRHGRAAHAGREDDEGGTSRRNHGRTAHGRDRDGEDDRGAHSRSGRAGSTARNRHGHDDETAHGSQGRTAHGRNADNGQHATAHGRSADRNRGRDDDHPSTHGRSGRTGHADAETHSAHGRSGGHDRRDGDEPRASRSRSGTQSRSAAHGRHPH